MAKAPSFRRGPQAPREKIYGQTLARYENECPRCDFSIAVGDQIVAVLACMGPGVESYPGHIDPDEKLWIHERCAR